MSRRRKLAIFSLVIFLIFFRAKWAFTVYGPFDAPCYMAWLYKFTFLPYNHCVSSAYFPGIAFLWLPAGWLGKILGLMTSYDAEHWVPPLVGLESFFCWGLALIKVDEWVQQTGERSLSWGAYWVLSVPVLYYATNRTTLTHAGEFLLVVLALKALWEKRVSIALFFCFWVCATRINDFPILFLAMGRLVSLPKSRGAVRLLAFGTLIVLAAVSYIGFFRGYNGTLINFRIFLSSKALPAWGRVRHVFFGDDWGMVWTAAWFLTVAFWGIFHLRRLSWAGRGALAWVLAEIYLCLMWQGNGRDFAYRYLIGSYGGALWIWLELAPSLAIRTRSVFNGLLKIQALWMLQLTWFYKSKPALLPKYLPSGIFTLPKLQLSVFSQSAKDWLETFGLSPLGYAFYSWGYKLNFFRDYAHYQKYAFSGFLLYFLTAVAIIAVMVLVGLVAKQKESFV